MRKLAMPDSADLLLQRKARGSLIAGAVADALGWPQEPNNRRPKNERLRQQHGWKFQQWSRRVGGRYLDHGESIAAGEYSDDTQLTLCTARSILAGKQWLDRFTQVELPTFQLYERGSGRATKRAVESWLSGSSPWTQKDASARDEYFNAGANGAMMRIAPHCLAMSEESSFSLVGKNILLNAICTHGHPKAILGALSFGFILWSSLRMTATLRYGELLQTLIDQKELWSTFPDVTETESWLSHFPGGRKKYLEGWNATVSEIIESARMCSSQLEMHSLSIEHDVLARLGAFSQQRGSGTITAVAAIFLASRFASEPSAGVMEAAYSEGADTDTLGSATGQLLGAINGDEWLIPLSDEVQDSAYIRSLSDKLTDGSFTEFGLIQAVSTSSLQKFKKVLDAVGQGDMVKFPDGREAQVIAINHPDSKSGSVRALSFHLKMNDGQDLYVPVVHREAGDRKDHTTTDQPPRSQYSAAQVQNGSSNQLPKSLPQQPIAQSESKDTPTSAPDCHITVTFIPSNSFLIQCSNGIESGSRILYSKEEVSQCLGDLAVGAPSKIISDLSTYGEDRLERYSFRTDRLDACTKWQLNKASDTERERERLAKQWLVSLINAHAEHSRLKDVRITVEDTRKGCTFRWFVGIHRVSLQLEIGELISFVLDSNLRREVDRRIERLFPNM